MPSSLTTLLSHNMSRLSQLMESMAACEFEGEGGEKKLCETWQDLNGLDVLLDAG